MKKRAMDSEEYSNPREVEDGCYNDGGIIDVKGEKKPPYTVKNPPKERMGVECIGNGE